MVTLTREQLEGIWHYMEEKDLKKVEVADTSVEDTIWVQPPHYSMVLGPKPRFINTRGETLDTRF